MTLDAGVEGFEIREKKVSKRSSLIQCAQRILKGKRRGRRVRGRIESVDARVASTCCLSLLSLDSTVG